MRPIRAGWHLEGQSGEAGRTALPAIHICKNQTRRPDRVLGPPEATDAAAEPATAWGAVRGPIRWAPMPWARTKRHCECTEDHPPHRERTTKRIREAPRRNKVVCECPIMTGEEAAFCW
ncbi:hypothetical protein NDU88_006144 [Pleurodeles waltl]|uniref:Uncharacterized protein n=1 Tax=Pleurodeles waltl TaxID=8319 RepID=A0AAV7VQK1_PLEWA|nr:hypothetical protein NDU88_006144 [Pleurodeles waltl]